jgi:peptidoglycan hydrolase CwlO-like protein
MLYPNKPFLRNLSILMLFLHPVAHAESNGLPQEGNPLQAELQQLQIQITNANDKITVLETAMNTVNQDIDALRNSAALKPHSRNQSDTTANTAVRRTANGHGR